MKSLLVTVLLLISGPVLASSGAENIYNALDVEEQPEPAVRTMRVYSKSVGGLVCRKVDHIAKGESYTCTLDIEESDSLEIYEALDVVPLAKADMRTGISYKKSIGGLVCVLKKNGAATDKATCRLNVL